MFRSRKPLPRVAAIAGALWLAGCVEADKAGTPHLYSFDLLDTSGTPVMKDPDAAVFTASPRVTFRAVFTDLLDFTQIVDVDAGVALPGLMTITTAGDQTLMTTYTHNGHHKFNTPMFFGGNTTGPNITSAPQPGLHSGATVSVALDVTRLRGRDGKPLIIDQGVPPTLVFETERFGVKGEPNEMPFAADHAFVVTASNIPAAMFATKFSASSTVDVTVTPVEVTVTVDETDPAKFLVAPAAGMWPAGALITVTIAADAADQFGAVLGAVVLLTFSVAAAMAAP